MYVNKEGLYDLRTGELVEKETNLVPGVWHDSISNDGIFMGRKSKPFDSLWFRETENDWHLLDPEDPEHFTLEEPKLSPNKKFFSYVKSGIPHSNQTGLYISDFTVCKKNPEKCRSSENGPLLDCISRSMSWSPDSKFLVCASSLLETVSIINLEKRILIPTPDDYFGALWSPDGNLIAYSGRDNDQNANLSIYIIPSQGGKPRKLMGGINTTGVVAWLNKVTPFEVGRHYQVLPLGDGQAIYKNAVSTDAIHSLVLGDVITIEERPIKNEHGNWWKIKDGEKEGWVLLKEDWLKDY
jgi:WD40 repeat protein